MHVALLIVRLVLAAVFALAGVAKLGDAKGSREAVIGFGVPKGLAAMVAAVLPVLEIGTAVLLIPVATAAGGGVLAGVLLVAFIGGITAAISRGEAPDCHCFGQVHSEPAGPKTLARNGVLLAGAGFVAIGGWNGGGVSATHWLTTLSTGAVLGGVAGTLLLALVAFQQWFSLQILAQNGTLLERIDALESTVAELAAGNRAGDAPIQLLGDGMSGSGLLVGTRAPEFNIEGIGGGRLSLTGLLESGRRVVLIFTDASCGPCTAMMGELAGWQVEHRMQLTIGLVASGDHDANLAKVTEHQLINAGSQDERAVSDAYKAHGTPVALAIAPDGTIETPAVGGRDKIADLIERALSTAVVAPPVRAARSQLTSRVTVPPRRPAQAPAPPKLQVAHSQPSGSRAGIAAPEFSLPDLDGALHQSVDLFREPTLAIFWNPGCGFCKRMVPSLQAFAKAPQTGAPRVVVISRGEAEPVRAQALGSLVLLDPEGGVASMFRAGGTPMGVIVENGRISSAVAAGADAVMALAGASADARSDGELAG